MARTRPRKTLADYVVIAISPALIMLLVGSLVFFLLHVTYDGRWEGRLQWILFWFVLASVLIARIAIEQGSQYASLYGLGLAAATALVIFRFVDAPLTALCLLGVVWWCANKLTWDCTLVDDKVDASGEGLLQRAGLDEDPPSPSPPSQGGDRGGVGNEGGLGSDPPRPPLRKGGRSAGGEGPSASNETAEQSAEKPAGWQQRLGYGKDRSQQPHAPGLWVLYFSLAALFMFGIGQLLVPADDATARTEVFRLLAVYVAAALGLLLTTSFLGLRRYLRQRRMKMPASMAGTWLGVGGLLIAVILLLCILLPRPNAQYSLTALLDKLAEKHQQASEHALLPGEGAEDEGRRIGREKQESKQKQDNKQNGQDAQGEAQQHGRGDAQRKTDGEQKQSRKGREQDQSGEGNQSRRKGDSDSQSRSDGTEQTQTGKQTREGQSRQGDRKGQQRRGDRSRQSNQRQQQRQQEQPRGEKSTKNGEKQTVLDENQQRTESPQSQTPSSSEWFNMAWLARLAKWLLYAVLAVAILWYLFKNRGQLLDALRQLWQQLLSLFGSSARERKPGDAVDQPETEPRRPRPFASFDNPFLTGDWRRLAPDAVTVYTFEALEAWAYEQGFERSSEQTPLEFAQILSGRLPEMSEELQYAGRLYARVAYADFVPSQEAAERLEGLWIKLSAAARSPASVDVV